MTKQNVTFPIGSIAAIDKIDAETGFFQQVLGKLAGRTRAFIPSVKLLMANKLGQSLPISRSQKEASTERLNGWVSVTSWSLKDIGNGWAARI